MRCLILFKICKIIVTPRHGRFRPDDQTQRVTVFPGFQFRSSQFFLFFIRIYCQLGKFQIPQLGFDQVLRLLSARCQGFAGLPAGSFTTLGEVRLHHTHRKGAGLPLQCPVRKIFPHRDQHDQQHQTRQQRVRAPVFSFRQAVPQSPESEKARKVDQDHHKRDPIHPRIFTKLDQRPVLPLGHPQQVPRKAREDPGTDPFQHHPQPCKAEDHQKLPGNGELVKFLPLVKVSVPDLVRVQQIFPQPRHRHGKHRIEEPEHHPENERDAVIDLTQEERPRQMPHVTPQQPVEKRPFHALVQRDPKQRDHADPRKKINIHRRVGKLHAQSGEDQDQNFKQCPPTGCKLWYFQRFFLVCHVFFSLSATSPAFFTGKIFVL